MKSVAKMDQQRVEDVLGRESVDVNFQYYETVEGTCFALEKETGAFKLVKDCGEKITDEDFYEITMQMPTTTTEHFVSEEELEERKGNLVSWETMANNYKESHDIKVTRVSISEAVLVVFSLLAVAVFAIYLLNGGKV